MALRVLRVYHAGRAVENRKRERALAALGVELTLVVPRAWPEAGAERELSDEPFATVELAVKRAGDINRHRYSQPERLRAVIQEVEPDLLDIHEEPYSLATRQWLSAAPAALPVVMFAAQNIDKRYPPPFAGFERAALRRVSGMYPCSSQAAAVVRGKGFAGFARILPLGYDPDVFTPGNQTLASPELTLMLAGRLVPQKGIEDAVHVLTRLNAIRPARLILVGEGPMAEPAGHLAASLGLQERIDVIPWQAEAELAALYRSAHVLLIPSIATHTWVEQFGRVITEAQASGAVVAGYASGAIPEVAGKAAVLVEPGALDALADGVAALVSNPAEYQRRRELGRAEVEPRTWTAVAAAHASLYETVLTNPVQRSLPYSPRARRVLAAAEFGSTAEALGDRRPFALPLLRRPGTATRLIGYLVDLAAEARIRARGRLSPDPHP